MISIVLGVISSIFIQREKKSNTDMKHILWLWKWHVSSYQGNSQVKILILLHYYLWSSSYCTNIKQDLKEIKIILEQQVEARQDIFHIKWQYIPLCRSFYPVLQSKFGSRLRYRNKHKWGNCMKLSESVSSAINGSSMTKIWIKPLLHS